MRVSGPMLLLTALSAAFAGASASCASSPAITVVRYGQGDKQEPVKGDPVKIRHGAQEFASMKGGFHVVRSSDDWHNVLRDKDSAMPPTIDTGREMMLLAVAESRNVREIKVTRALETAEFIHVFVRETTLGENCAAKKLDQIPRDSVVTQRIDKPVKFYVEEERGESCGDPPTTKVACRLSTDQQAAWSPTLSAQPGDTIECELTAESRGRFELVDRMLQLGELPAGSSAKLTFAKGPTRASVGLDVYGTYNVRAEVADEGGRHANATATIDAKPPKTKDLLVQLVWTNFDLRDEPDTFPRTTLRVAEMGAKGQRCTVDIPVPGLCEARQQSAYTYMKIPAGDRKLPLSVLYLDERIENGPGPCVHVWFDGERTGEACDRKHRDAEERWDVGVLDSATGKIGDPVVEVAAEDAGAPPPPAPAKPTPKKK